MSFLGSVGSLYMIILTILLVIGFGFTGLALVRFIFGTRDNAADKRKNNINSEIGGFKFMNSWLRLALFSFVAILISMAVLAFISPGGLVGNNMNSNMYYGNMPMYNTTGNIQMTGNMPMNQSSGGMGMMNMGGMGSMGMPMGNMQTQGVMPMNQGTGSMTMTTMPSNNMQMNTNSMMQMLNQMQMQLNQMQQQIQQINMGGSSGGSMPSSGGGMGMM